MSNHIKSPILTLEEAAQFLQVTPDELLAEILAGKVPARQIAGKWRLSRDSLRKLFEDFTSESPTVTSEGPLESVALYTDPLKDKQVTARELDSEIALVDTSFQVVTVATQAQIRDQDDKHAGKDEPVKVESTSGRVRGTVYSYNIRQGFGHARLPDNRVVWVESNELINEADTLYTGLIIEFDLHYVTNRGLVAKKIAKSRISDIGKEESEKGQERVSFPVQPPKKQTPISGSTRAQNFYQKAALARTEGRFDEARHFFNKAIESGAGAAVYTAFFKMADERGWHREASKIIQQAISEFPSHAAFYEMYGQLERRGRNYTRAVAIFREGLIHSPTHVSLRWGLGQTLVQIGTEQSLKEAATIFAKLDSEKKLNKDDRIYQRFQALRSSPRANRVYDFLQQIPSIKMGLFGIGRMVKQELPSHITDIIVETANPELSESFGLTGAFLVRCFRRDPRQSELQELSQYIRSLGPQGEVVGLQDRKVVLHSSMAFVAVPNSSKVRDQIMSLLSENNEAIVPLDDQIFGTSEPLNALREVLGQYLGSRDLYSSTQPVSGRRFFGRDRLLRQLTDEVSRGEFLGLYGLRKMGKTSLIYQFRDQRLVSEAVAYVDLQASHIENTKNCNPLYYELERDLYVRLRSRSIRHAELLRLGKIERYSDLGEQAERASLIFVEDMKSFLNALSKDEVPGVRRLVIVLDELEKILPLAGQSRIDGYLEFFGLLRGLAQTERYRGLISSVVVAANASISERGYWEGRENPVFALYKPVFLTPLSEVECEEMILTLGKGMSVYWEPEAIHTVFQETGGHPFLTRSLCSRIARQHPIRPLTVSSKMVMEQIRPFIRDEGTKLSQITELLHNNFPEEEQFLVQIALNEHPADLPDEHVSHLLHYHLVATDGQDYRVTLNLLRRWLRRQAGIRDEI